MSRLIDDGLKQLSNLLGKMGELTEKTVSLSFDVSTRGVDSADRVRVYSETLISSSEEIEEKSTEVIARYQPVASDLRTIRAYMKIAYDLARIGRYAWDISFIYKRFNISFEECSLPWLPLTEMMKEAQKIIQMSVEAITRKDLKLARKIGEIESGIDKMYIDSLNKLVDQAPIKTKCVVANLLFVRHLERIADHAAYIGESVIYLVTGERANL
ncbi:MAG: phosphate signaling complex protein PhoU [Promethearchaeati archaeon SRVP18_Atabeyarchaeia-1]